MTNLKFGLRHNPLLAILKVLKKSSSERERQGRVSRKPVSCAFSIFKLTDGTYAYRIPNGFEKLFHAKLLASVGGTNEATGGLEPGCSDSEVNALTTRPPRPHSELVYMTTVATLGNFLPKLVTFKQLGNLVTFCFSLVTFFRKNINSRKYRYLNIERP